MPLLWEAHRDLSLTLGDSVGLEDFSTSNPPTFIPDGVRASKALRDSYLYRAMLSLMNDMLRQVVGADRKIANEIIMRMFPHMISRAEVNIPSLRRNTFMDITGQQLGNKTLLYLISVDARNQYKRYPVPIKSASEANRLMNDRNVQRSDAFCTYFTIVAGDQPDATKLRLYIYDQTDLLYDFTDVYLTFLPYPTNPSSQQLDEELDFEVNYYNTIIELGTIYGMAESQDLQAPERFYPHVIDTQVKGGNNVGSPTQ